MPHTQEITAALYIVSTPIGNLEDITLRAIRILKQVDLVAAEDTRHSKKLFLHYQIRQRLVSFHDHNKERVTPGLISHILEGKSLALISDAGTPGVADPAFYLVRAALKKNITVIPVPGPSAMLSALVVSGLPTDRFIFENFLAPKSAKRIKRLEELGREKRTVVVYESPHRIQKTLEDMAGVL
jgi:16S rRNA (cytidine1402-2'-O)-methyltransferase